MSNAEKSTVKNICAEFDNDRTRMMDIVNALQTQLGCIDRKAMQTVAECTGCHQVEVESVVSFYAFLSTSPKGETVIRLCDDVIDEIQGSAAVAKAFKETLGIKFGETTADGKVTLEWTPCIGMCDQAPACLVNNAVVTNLNAEKARQIANEVLKNGTKAKLGSSFGDGHNADDLVQSMVINNIRRPGPVILDDFESGSGLHNALALSPAEVIRDIKTSRLRGRGGAGFPTGMKWDFTRQAPGKEKFIICNADEGEPGTFKDRILLTECADLLFEGMAIAGYAIGADCGILYLRAEYAYLRPYLEDVLNRRREKNLLGRNICGKDGFDFDIRIQMGAGAYICGEETSLISSCEGLRGDPKNRPPFPAQKGYKELPTTVNNVETFCCAARILEKGPGWFAQIGSKGSAGTKILSISGDCSRPGLYEVPFGTTIKEMLKMCGAADTKAIQIGGPSGQMIGTDQFERTICYDDLATGGSVMIFNKERDVLTIANKFMEFFIEESCGHCTPCRVGNVLLQERLARIIAGKGVPADLPYLEDLGSTVKVCSRCGLGQTSPNPILSTLKNFRDEYTARLQKDEGLNPAFDIKKELAVAEDLIGRESVIY